MPLTPGSQNDLFVGHPGHLLVFEEFALQPVGFQVLTRCHGKLSVP